MKNDKVTYYIIGDWWIKEHSKTAWIYKKDVCYCRIPIKSYLREKELRHIIENFLVFMGEFYE